MEESGSEKVAWNMTENSTVKRTNDIDEAAEDPVYTDESVNETEDDTDENAN